MKVTAFCIEKTYEYGIDDICDYSVQFNCRMGSKEYELLMKMLNDGELTMKEGKK